MSDDEWQQLLGDELGPGSVLAEKYRLEEIVGRGAMGCVVQAWHLQLEERVAVKFLQPEFIESEEATVRFEREARAAFKIKSEHIARVLDVGRLPSGMPYIVMEFLEGRELAQLVEDGAGLPIEDAIDYVLQACEAIAEAHTLGIVHRDLKPENLFLTVLPDGREVVKVLDFGLSKIAPRPNDGKRQRALTTSEQVMGTAHYMSPEQWLSAKDVGPSTDIWSLGVILYELIAGDAPFQGEQIGDLCALVLRAELPPIRDQQPDVPEELEQVLATCLAREPADRYADVGQFASALLVFAPERSHASAHRIARVVDKAAVVQASGDAQQDAPPAMALLDQHLASATAAAAAATVASVPPPPLPRLGLPNEHGGFDMWQDLLQEDPPPQSRTSLLVGGGIMLAAVVLLAWALGIDPGAGP